MEPKSQEVFRGTCRVCDCHLPHEEMPEIPNRRPRRSNIFLRRKREAEESEFEEPEVEEIESESESVTEEAGDAAPEAEEDKVRKELNEKIYSVMKKKWELKEEQELLKIKEQEMDLDSEEINIEVKKMELKEVERDIQKQNAKLKDLYVQQLNLHKIDGLDDEEVAKEDYDIEMTIESVEANIELLKSRGRGLELMIRSARDKIMAGRAKIAKSRSDIKAAKEIREREMKEEEEGKWPGEPRWLI